MSVRPLVEGDLDWVVRRLARRRATLVPYAPVLWNRAIDADRRHRAYLSHVLGDLGGCGVRTDDALMIAVPTGTGWTVDDAAAPDDEWATTGRALFTAVAANVGDVEVRFVCPRPEHGRAALARRMGLTLAETWWHRELAPSVAGSSGETARVELDGATARLTEAPDIYDPGGPVLFVSDITDPRTSLPAAGIEGARLGSPLVVVAQQAADHATANTLTAAGYVAHCDFFTGRLSAHAQVVHPRT